MAGRWRSGIERFGPIPLEEMSPSGRRVVRVDRRFGRHDGATQHHLNHVIYLIGVMAIASGFYLVAESHLARLPEPVRRARMGWVLCLAFAAMMVVCIASGSAVGNDVYMDARGAVVLLATFFGGAMTGGVVTGAGILTRLLRGVGTGAGLAALAVEYAVAILLARRWRRDGREGREGAWPMRQLAIGGGLMGVLSALSLWASEHLGGEPGLFWREGADAFLTQVLCTIGVGALIRFQREWRASRELFEGALRTSFDGFALIGEDGSIREANAALERLTGRSRAELIGGQLLELDGGAGPEEFEALHARLRAEGTTRFERCWRRADGKVLTLEISAAVAPASVGGHYSFVRDITESKAAEARLRRQEERLRVALDAADTLVWELDAGTRRLEYSANLTSLAGSTEVAPYLELETFIEMVHPEDREATSAAIRRTLELGVPFECQYRVFVPAGMYRCMFGKARVIRGADGRVTRVVGATVDISAYREAREAELREQLLTRTLIESIPGAFYMLDSENRYVRWNSYLRDEIAGLTDAEMPFKSALDCIHPEDREAVRARLELVLRTGRDDAIEARALLRGGPEFRWFLLNGRRLVVNGKHFVIGVGVDLTERRRLGELVEEERIRLAGIIEATNVGTWEWNVSTGEVVLNARWAEIVGSTLEELGPIDIGTWQRFAHPEDLARSNRLLEKHFSGELPYFECEVRMRHREGHWVWILDRGKVMRRDGKGRPLLMLGTHTDITVRRNAEEALRTSEQRFRAYMEQAADPVLVHDSEGRIQDANPRATEFLGYSREELLRMRMGDLDPEFDLKRAQGEWSRAVPQGQANFVGILQRRDGSTFPAEMRYGHFDMGGEHLYLAHVRDISERNESERRARVLRDLGLELVRVSDLGDALARCLRAGRDVSGMESGGIYLSDAETGGLRLELHAGLGAEFVRAVETIPADAPNARWARQGQSFHGSADELGLPSDAPMHVEGLRTVSMMPIRHDGVLIAVLNLASHREIALGTAARSALESVAGVVGGVLLRLRAERELRKAHAELELRVLERTRDLARSEERFRTLFETSRDAVLTTDEGLRITDCNPAAVAMLGYQERCEIVGKQIQSLSPEVQWDGRASEEWIGEIRARLMEQSGHFFRWDYRRADGSVFPAEVAVSVAVVDGKLVMQGLTRDISERKAAEDELRMSEARFRRVIEMSPIPMGLTSRDGRITMLNARHSQTFGWTPEDLPTLEAWWNKAYPDPEYRREVQESWQDSLAVSSGGAVDVEARPYRITCKDGTVRDVLISGVQLGTEFLATFLDVTRLHEATENLRKLSQAVEFNPSMIFITDAEGRVEYVNPAWERVTGYRSEDILGRKPAMIRSGLHSREFYSHLWSEISAGRVWRGEFCNRRKDGQLYWESCSIAPVLDSQGRIRHYVSAKEDITASREAAEELRTAKEAADAANHAKSRFLANMSHEIRTPMNAILGFARLLQRDLSLGPRQRHQLSIINQSGEHLLQLINDVLDMSKIEAGRMRLALSDCDFPGLLSEMESLFRVRAEERGLKFQLRRADALPPRIRTDPAKVRQILLNILGNAVKFTSTGSIDTWVEVESLSRSAVDMPAIRLRIEVRDTGEGIAPEDLDRVFEAFEQAKVGVQKAEGTGLGMAISRQLARMLGGDLSATSQLGQGSCFVFTFDALIPPTLTGATGTGTTSGTRAEGPARILRLKPGGPRPPILIVDDIPSNRDLLRALLEDSGFAVSEAGSAQEALRRFGSDRPALVLMDRRMPGMDGLVGTRLLREAQGGKAVRILILSAGVLETREDDWLAAGADGFLGKPFRDEELLRRIGELLGLELIDAGGTGLPEAPDPLADGAVRALPEELRRELTRTTESGDITRLRELIAEQVTPGWPGVAGGLLALADRYDYAGLQRILSES